VVELIERSRRAQAAARKRYHEIVLGTIRSTWRRVGSAKKLTEREAKLVKMALRNVDVLRTAVVALEAARDGLTVSDYHGRLRQIVKWADIWSKGTQVWLSHNNNLKRHLAASPPVCLRTAEDMDSAESMVSVLRAHRLKNPASKLGTLIQRMQAGERLAAKKQSAYDAIPTEAIARGSASAGLLPKKNVKAEAWDAGTRFQVRVAFSVGDPDAPGPARAFVTSRGNATLTPELLLWFVVRVLADAEGLDRRSPQVMGLGTSDYLSILRARADGRADRSRSGRIWKLMLRSMKLTRRAPVKTDVAIVVNLVRGPRAEVKWLSMVHLQGPVGDVAMVYAPWMVWDHFETSMPQKDKLKLRRYLKALSPYLKAGRLGNPIAAARAVNAVIRQATVSR